MPPTPRSVFFYIVITILLFHGIHDGGTSQRHRTSWTIRLTPMKYSTSTVTTQLAINTAVELIDATMRFYNNGYSFNFIKRALRQQRIPPHQTASDGCVSGTNQLKQSCARWVYHSRHEALWWRLLIFRVHASIRREPTCPEKLFYYLFPYLGKYEFKEGCWKMQ